MNANRICWAIFVIHMHIEILFDGGGTKQTEAYGSYRITNGERSAIRRVVFGTGFTNNEAEYLTLIAALDYVLEGLDKRGKAPFDVSLTIKGDSMLVKEQVGTYSRTVREEQDARRWTGWKVNIAHLLPLRDKARQLLAQFYSFDYQHIPRKEVVAVLGH